MVKRQWKKSEGYLFSEFFPPWLAKEIEKNVEKEQLTSFADWLAIDKKNW